MELTILMPCLNEALTIEACVSKALGFLERRKILGEVLIADNGSTDGSEVLALNAGARVINIESRGYGAALIGGITAALGRFIIIGDADDSYDFGNLDAFLDNLRSGSKLVVGNRFAGSIMPGAMPPLNRYLGNPFLSFVGRKLFASPLGDFHCGVRGFDRQAILDLELKASGMEFASEMIVKASLAQLEITEVPTTLCPDGRQRAPHLRPWRDGWRHLRFMLLRSPQWLFLYPGLILAASGIFGATVLTRGPIRVLDVFTLDINTLLFFSIGAIVGTQIAFFGLFAIAIARKMNLLIARGFPDKLLRAASHDRAVIFGSCLVVTGLAGALFALFQWRHVAFGALIPSDMMRITIPAVTSLAIGTQVVFGSFLLGFIEIE